ncbi:glutaredoxin family protein [Candidatus Parcubacteria bacterium]|nr:MAG: glutaredoxin family protein [Candidatus Parcubacteria bacterium]GIW69124.1 MAG: NrdH-redoxin [Candidatus Parcubacteria bacterium]
MASVVIYTSPTCHFCHMAKEFFAEHNVEYEERDVASNPEFAREVVERSGQMGVPVVFVTKNGGEEEMVVGFDEARLREVLNIQE